MTTKRMEDYFSGIDCYLKKGYLLANEARKKGYDPEEIVEILLVKDMAERVEGLISVAAPGIKNSGVSDRIKELENKYGCLDWRVSLVIALEVAQEKFCKFKDKKEAMEIGIRVGFAYITMGVVASPLEGFVDLTIKKRRDGGEYFAIKYAGPVRSAGGTGAAVSAIIVDYIRKKMGYQVYDPTEEEVNRLATELYDYHERVTNLQYLPSKEEIIFLAKRLPVQIDGDGSEKFEVSNYKDLDRIETNIIRNGVCLVIGEGIAQKAAKLWKQLSKWKDEFGLEQWGFLKEFIELQKKIKAKGETVKGNGSKISPDHTYIKDIVAGRPVFTHPLRAGGFRLRYGRTRFSGYSANAIHPATMHILNSYLAVGTQLKVERPGKATSITSCETIEGPIVKLKDGSVVHLSSLEDAKSARSKIEEILFLGDLLVNYGDFYNRAHPLVPPGYCEEWWFADFEKGVVDLFGSLDLEKVSGLVGIPAESLSKLFNDPITTKISAEDAVNISKKMNIPIHPAYSYHFNNIQPAEFSGFLGWVKTANLVKAGGKVKKAILPFDESKKRVLELLGVPHILVNKEFVVIEKEHATIITEMFGLEKEETIQEKAPAGRSVGEGCPDALNQVNQAASFKVMDKSGIFVGARMGRPEKAKMRKLDGSPQVLFPVGVEGGRLRSFQSALAAGKINGDFPVFQCVYCSKETIYPVCETCGRKTKKSFFCKSCGVLDTGECAHGASRSYTSREIDIKRYFDAALKHIKTQLYPDLIKGVRGTSNKEHIPENLVKGVLRAKHNIYVNKDGTTRYDMTQLPVTHFKPKEIGTSIKKLRELGYKTDINGKEITLGEQTIEIFPQDIILPSCDGSLEEGADKVLSRVCSFIDELLQKFYGLNGFYNLKTPEDIVGHLVICLAPHTSAGIVARIIGFSKTQGFFAHPLLHAATRRDCDGDEACVTILLDALLNFSRHYLPAHRGSTQDAPLVLTSKLIPSEVDDMVFDVDVGWKYPLEFYKSCLDYKSPWDVKIEQLGPRLNTDKQYYDFGFTHPVEDINNSVLCSAYKTLPSMEEKLRGQMDIAEKTRAVDAGDVARLVIEKHFLRDTKGNLRKFSMQQFRCVQCNDKYRRPPLLGKCENCGGRIIFTISEGSVVKYLGPSLSLAQAYNVPDYLKQSLEILQRRVEALFGREKEKQAGLGAWFG